MHIRATRRFYIALAIELATLPAIVALGIGGWALRILSGRGTRSFSAIWC